MLRLLVLIHQQTNTTNTCWFVTRNEKNLTLVAQTKTKHTGLGPCERVHYAVSDTTPMASEHVCSDDLSVAIAAGKRPVTIPNPEAKPARADGTAPGKIGRA